jgi:hypothetical protein
MIGLQKVGNQQTVDEPYSTYNKAIHVRVVSFKLK